MSESRDLELFGKGQLAKQLEDTFGEILNEKRDRLLQKAFSDLASGDLSGEKALGVVAQLAALESIFGAIRRDKKRATQAGDRMRPMLETS